MRTAVVLGAVALGAWWLLSRRQNAAGAAWGIPMGLAPVYDPASRGGLVPSHAGSYGTGQTNPLVAAGTFLSRLLARSGTPPSGLDPRSRTALPSSPGGYLSIPVTRGTLVETDPYGWYTFNAPDLTLALMQAQPADISGGSHNIGDYLPGY
jgi:hypothetical protein